MAPPAADVELDLPSAAPVSTPATKLVSKTGSGSRLTSPLKYSGSLDSYEHFDVTNVIGREFPTLQISEILNDDTKIRDLAILSAFPLPSVRLHLWSSLEAAQPSETTTSESAH